MDVLADVKGELRRVAVIDVTSLLCESEDDLVQALFDEALDGFAVPIEPEDPHGRFEVVKLSPGDAASIAAFENFLQSHGYEVKDAEA